MEVAHRRIPSKLSPKEARTPKGSGPFCLPCFAISGVSSPHRQNPPRRRSGGMCRKVIPPVQRRRTGQRPARCPSREDTTEMEKRVIRFSQPNPSGTGPCRWPSRGNRPQRLGGAGTRNRTLFSFVSSRVSSMDQSTCLRSKGLHVRVVHVGPICFAVTTKESPCASATPRSG